MNVHSKETIPFTVQVTDSDPLHFLLLNTRPFSVPISEALDRIARSLSVVPLGSCHLPAGSTSSRSLSLWSRVLRGPYLSKHPLPPETSKDSSSGSLGKGLKWNVLGPWPLTWSPPGTTMPGIQDLGFLLPWRQCLEGL